LYLNPDGSLQDHHYRLLTYGAALGVATGLRRLPVLQRRLRTYRMIGEDFSHSRVVEQPSASCLLLRRSALPGGPLFDERYPIYFNDVDLARRLADRGWKLWVTPDAAVMHELGASTRLLGSSRDRHHLGALVRYVAATESRRRLRFLQLMLLAEGGLRLALRRPAAQRPGDLIAAVCGDVGPLPEPVRA
jgi:GT2 family glycosyltransferase